MLAFARILAEGPTVVVSGAATWAILVGSVCTALLAVLAFWKKVIAPLLSTASTITESFPIWVDIAAKFHSPKGEETLSSELQALAANQEISAANQRAMMAQLETVIAQAHGLDVRVVALDTKLSETRHDVIGKFAVLSATADGANTLVDAIVRTSEELRSVRAELAALQAPKE